MTTKGRRYVLFFLLALGSSSHGQFKTNEQNQSDSSVPSLLSTTYSGPKSITRNIKQDRNGNIWFASWEGIFKYNGSSFVNVSSGISTSRFFSVLADSKGTYWFGSIGSGVYHYDGKSFNNFTVKEGLADDVVLDIYEDSKGHIWFATEGGASRYDGKSFTNFTTEQGLLNNRLNAILEDDDGKIWLASRGELSIYDGNQISGFTYTFNNARSLIKDRKGQIWIGGYDGLWRYDGEQLTRMATEFTGYIHEDKTGSIWTSSMNDDQSWALTRYDENSWNKEAMNKTKIWDKEGMIFGILEDSKGMIWFGTLGGVCKYDYTEVVCYR